MLASDLACSQHVAAVRQSSSSSTVIFETGCDTFLFAAVRLPFTVENQFHCAFLYKTYIILSSVFSSKDNQLDKRHFLIVLKAQYLPLASRIIFLKQLTSSFSSEGSKTVVIVHSDEVSCKKKRKKKKTTRSVVESIQKSSEMSNRKKGLLHQEQGDAYFQKPLIAHSEPRVHIRDEKDESKLLCCVRSKKKAKGRRWLHICLQKNCQ